VTLTPAQRTVLEGIRANGYDLSEAWERFAHNKGLPHVLLHNAFDKVIAALLKRGLIEKGSGEEWASWRVTPKGKELLQ
jgi:hypothetical protein